MDTTLLRHVLLDATVQQLGDVIDWLERPWAPSDNDALRAAWHEARRHPEAKRALAYAVEQEIRRLDGPPGGRDAAHVAQRLGLPLPTAQAIAGEVTRRLSPTLAWPFSTSPEVVASALRATADIAQLVLGNGGSYGRGRRRHRHGRR